MKLSGTAVALEKKKPLLLAPKSANDSSMLPVNLK